MPSKAQIKGSLGEDAAVKHLEDNGFSILVRNYRTKNAEIDIIAKDKDTIAFIEVKTRTTLRKGYPSESVNYKKQKKIILASQYYIRENNLNNIRLRFDVVEILINNGHSEIKLIKNAFQVT